MGHFEKGAWVETPFDKLESTLIQFCESLQVPFQNLYISISESVTKPTGIYRNGKSLSLVDLANEMTERHRQE